jgi:hypothetical protein
MRPENCRFLKLGKRYIKDKVWNCLILSGSCQH